jgi:hypothetical protein
LLLLADVVPEPVLADLVLADPVLAEPVLAALVLAGPVLVDPVLADPVLADAVLVGEGALATGAGEPVTGGIGTAGDTGELVRAGVAEATGLCVLATVVAVVPAVPVAALVPGVAQAETVRASPASAQAANVLCGDSKVFMSSTTVGAREGLRLVSSDVGGGGTEAGNKYVATPCWRSYYGAHEHEELASEPESANAGEPPVFAA